MFTIRQCFSSVKLCSILRSVEEPTPNHSSRFIILAIVIIVVLVGIGFYARHGTSQQLGAKVAQPLTTAAVAGDETGARVAVPVDSSDITLGQANAPVTMIAFTNFTSPYYAQFQQQDFAQLAQDDIASGKVKYVLKYVPPLDVNEDPADAESLAEAGKCINAQSSDAFWKYVTAVLAKVPTPTDPSASPAPSPSPVTTAQLLTYARQAGVPKLEEFTTCINAHTYQHDLAANAQEAISTGVIDVPTFVIGGRLVGGVVPREQLQQIIDTAANSK